MDLTRPTVQSEKDTDPLGQRIVCKYREVPVNLGPDADKYALCQVGPHWVEKEEVRFGVCRSCLANQRDYVPTGTLKRKCYE